MQDENAHNPDSMPTMPPRDTPRGPAADSMPTMEPNWRSQAEWGGRRWQPGEEILGRYVVESELGRGGMGVVYGCFDKVGRVRVAVKALPPEVVRDREEMEDVRDNFRLVSGLRHPNIAGIRTLEEDSRGECFLVMDLAEGKSLRGWLKSKWKAGETVSVEDAVPILRQVAAALDYAHKMKVLHRDVKPGNVMIDATGEVKVLDFGLASQIQSSLSRVSRDVGGTSGTRPYMAPEQWEGRRQDAKTDQYSLAALAYEMLSGVLPFDGTDFAILKDAVLHADIEDIPGASAAAMAALRRAMAKTRGERFSTCGEFVEALAGGSSAHPVEARQDAAPPEGGTHLARVAAIPSAEERRAGDVRTIALPGGATMEMVWCPPGEFTMGSPEDEEGRGDDETQHRVTLTRGFWMAKTEVTQAQWRSVTGNNPSRWKGNGLPVERVSWNDCQEFCRKTGLRLPTEAEWEYACRAGSTGPYAETGKLADMGWYDRNSRGSMSPGEQNQSNAWGLFDMHGNVWEWCADWYGAYPSAAVTDPAGPGSGVNRVIRGGSGHFAKNCRSAYRGVSSPGDRGFNLGFRPAKDSLP